MLSFVMNESALAQEAKAWLWHHRFRHLSFADAAKLGLGFTKAPKFECAICDKKGSKEEHFTANHSFFLILNRLSTKSV